jgi:hypothetical protein
MSTIFGEGKQIFLHLQLNEFYCDAKWLGTGNNYK